MTSGRGLEQRYHYQTYDFKFLVLTVLTRVHLNQSLHWSCLRPPENLQKFFLSLTEIEFYCWTEFHFGIFFSLFPKLQQKLRKGILVARSVSIKQRTAFNCIPGHSFVCLRRFKRSNHVGDERQPLRLCSVRVLNSKYSIFSRENSCKVVRERLLAYATESTKRQIQLRRYVFDINTPRQGRSG